MLNIYIWSSFSNESGEFLAMKLFLHFLHHFSELNNLHKGAQHFHHINH